MSEVELLSGEGKILNRTADKKKFKHRYKLREIHPDIYNPF